MKKWYADIIVDISQEKLDRTFQYEIPQNLLGIIKTGTKVEFADKQNVEIENLMPWSVGFPAYVTLSNLSGGFCVSGGKHIYLEDSDSEKYLKGTFKMTVEELREQINGGNRGFVGTDGHGKHACMRINDLELYRYIFNLPDAKELPVQLTQEAISELLDIDEPKKFKEELKNLVHTDSEKKAFAYFVWKHPKINEVPYSMIKAMEDYTGFDIAD